jgi:hypothetical protein
VLRSARHVDRAGQASRGIDLLTAAVERAGFIAALRAVDLAGGPVSEFLPADDATWERGRGWALALGLRCAAYTTGNPLLGGLGRYTISQVLTGSGAGAQSRAQTRSVRRPRHRRRPDNTAS